jgi:mannose-1-phosphate guanylyltransferase
MVSKNQNELAESMFALILAGGVGTRLWPKSRKDKPKQLLDIVSQSTMLQETCNRIRPIIPHERIFVVTNGAYAATVREQVPEMPARNVIAEPAGRGTAPCIGLSSLYLRRLDPNGTMASLHADHVIHDAEGFRKALRAAARLAQQGYLVTLGIRPDSPHTGYGYIQQGAPLGDVGGFGASRVSRFTEKPDRATAEQFVQSKEYFWNSGIFVWKISAIMEAIEKHLPDLAAQLRAIDAAIGTESERDVLEQVWAEVRDQSIDVGILERADNVAVIPISVGWSDVGSWATLIEILPRDGNENVIVGGEHIGIDTSGSLLYGTRRLVAAIGLKDMIVVDTDDVVLVCPKDRAQDVKHIIAELKRQGKEKYL